MSRFLKSVVAATMLWCASMSGNAQADGSSPEFPFAATGFLGGGGAWLDPDFPGADIEIATIVGGGDFVIPVTGYWNIQLGGAWRWEESTLNFGGGGGISFTETQFQGGGIGFWRDPMTGVFGIEAGLFSPPDSSENYIKLGGVAEYFISDLATMGGFGGILLPVQPHPSGPNFQYDEGYYAGGHLTYYADDNIAIAAQARWLERNTSFIFGETEARRSLHVSGKIRYLTSMSGVELFLLGGYRRCERETNFVGGPSRSEVNDGAEVLAGVNIRLGGQSGSLVDIDRTNALDTRAWYCDILNFN